MRNFLILCSLFVAFHTSASAASSPAEFHRSLYTLHEQRIIQNKVRLEADEGEYEGASAAGYRYVDTRYYDITSGKLLSRVRRDAARPEFVHIVEVNIYEEGKLVRDFGSVSLPWASPHPVRTFINLHQYNGELHSFRQYDFFGQKGYEFCDGKLAGKPVKISLDDSDINESTTATEAYKACFNGMNKDWAQYKTPH